ncbi:putative glucoamylase I (alpha-1,4-glucan glucosidase), extracellular starch-degrading enzyme [Psychromonas ingrahamii 37]|uniref:Putative glucoamylase I (Alpha-1,4-glucan glucosidase), extracellular starch-degrading enzyme n=1 Tax=Psychromonas ingrahamii (strain DSM 17664 / CCUG 51855 / 37) TaxID=357804 RepID=A1SZ52_PSYIN|nr:hypothetical protein [Psychromonas ingrahamii]ABM04767.1 putative glucoamylase I (alpha-1,4-glucan glucosidase), extracellular starch-degrading enzyme [Psychromonas ingrahamii 37]
MKSILKISKLAALITLVTTAGLANAASQGSTGGTSTGSSEVTVSVEPRIVINNVADVSTTSTGTGDLELINTMCVGTNVDGGTYKVAVTGTGGTTDAFSLVNALDDDTIPYTASWADTVAATTVTALVSGAPLSSQTSTINTACGTDNATLILDIAESELQGATAGDYTGTVTMVVTPI